MKDAKWIKISKKIRKAMIDEGFRNIDLANKLGLSEHHVSSVITGYVASKKSRIKICKYLGIDYENSK